MAHYTEKDRLIVNGTIQNTAEKLNDQETAPTDKTVTAYRHWYTISKEYKKVENSDDAGTGQGKSLFFGGMYTLVKYLYKHRNREISHDDIKGHYNFGLTEKTFMKVSKIVTKQIEKNEKNDSSFLNVWFRFTSIRMVFQVLTVLLHVLATMFTFAFLPYSVISYLEEPYTSSHTIKTLVILTVGLFTAKSLFLPITIQLGTEIGYRFRCGLLALGFDKLLKLQFTDSSTIANVMTIVNQGSQRFYNACVYMCYIPGSVMALVASTVYLYILVGVWAFVGMGIFTIVMMLRVMSGFLNLYLRRKMLVYTERRVRKMQELLQSIRLIKMYGWEDSFLKSVEDVRKEEIFYNFLALLSNSICSNLSAVVPSLASIATLYCYYLTYNKLEASTSFTVLAIFNVARANVLLIGLSFQNIGEITVVSKRVQQLLSQPEFKCSDDFCIKPYNVIETDHADFSWNASKDINGECNPNSHEPFQLRDIHLTIQKKKLIGICGAVGSGKSSLLSALISRMDLTSGACAVDGTVGYVPQQAWVFNATLRENILFSKEFDRVRYNNVLNACSLIEDIDMFPKKDLSEIGERGLNLSGGQKQRISLARAVYNDSDVYLLDDPLSAMDVHVGKHVFMNCIKNMLRNKTVILVSHQMQYLEYCDEIMVINGGKVSESGTHSELMESKSLYHQLYDQYVKEKPEEEVDEEDKDIKGEQKTNDKSKTSTSNGLLTEKESSVVGRLSWATIRQYIRACGGFCMVLSVLFMYVLCVGYQTFVAWWLSLWIGQLQHVPNNTSNGLFINMSDLHSTDVNLNKYPTVFILSIAILIVLSVSQSIFATSVMVKGSTNLHNDALRHIMKSPVTFFDTNPTGRILNRFTSDVDYIDVYLPLFMNPLCNQLLSSILSLIVAIYHIPWILLLCIPIGAVVLISNKVIISALFQIKRLESTSFSPLLSHVTSTASGLFSITAFGQTNNMWMKALRLTDVNACLMYIGSNIKRWQGLVFDIFLNIFTIGAILILIFTKGSLDPAFAGLVLTMCIKAVSPVSSILFLYSEICSKLISVERLGEYCDLKEVDKDSGVPEINFKNNWPSRGRVRFANVCMKYRHNTPAVLRNISFCALPGENVGIVGRTGAGKSSIMAALFRLYELATGHIFIDYVDIATIDKAVLRNNIFNIPQDPVLFNGTIRFNLDPVGVYSDEQLWATLEQVHMKTKILKSPQKLDYDIQEGGSNLSVGERQLICLGRAILRKPCVLMLDEATASIDTNTDFMIQQTIREQFSTCTVITIAHRLNTILHCDRIVLLDQGQVVESGSPTELLADRNSEFYSMYQAQSFTNF